MKQTKHQTDSLDISTTCTDLALIVQEKSQCPAAKATVWQYMSQVQKKIGHHRPSAVPTTETSSDADPNYATSSMPPHTDTPTSRVNNRDFTHEALDYTPRYLCESCHSKKGLSLCMTALYYDLSRRDYVQRSMWVRAAQTRQYNLQSRTRKQVPTR